MGKSEVRMPRHRDEGLCPGPVGLEWDARAKISCR